MRGGLLETTDVTTKRVRPEFGEAVSSVLKEHGLSLRAARIRTGIDHVTLSDMAAGYVPRLEQVERFATGFGLDVNKWRVLAGHPEVSPTDPAPLRISNVTDDERRIANVFYRLGHLQTEFGVEIDVDPWLSPQNLARPVAELEGDLHRLEAQLRERSTPERATAPPAGYMRFVMGLSELAQELGRAIPVALEAETARNMTVKDAEETLATLRRQAAEGLF